MRRQLTDRLHTDCHSVLQIGRRFFKLIFASDDKMAKEASPHVLAHPKLYRERPLARRSRSTSPRCSSRAANAAAAAPALGRQDRRQGALHRLRLRRTCAIVLGLCAFRTPEWVAAKGAGYRLEVRGSGCAIRKKVCPEGTR